MDKAKIQIIFIILTWFVVYSPQPCQAASITLSGSSTWTIGTLGAGLTSTSPGSPNTWTVTNDYGRYEYVGISVATTLPVGSAWVPIDDGYGNPVGAVYSLNLQPGGSRVTTSSFTYLVDNLAPGATSGFGLSFTCPTSAEAGIEHTLTVTLTASRLCYGELVSDVCWYLTGAPAANPCSTVCATHGGCECATTTAAEQAAFHCNSYGTLNPVLDKPHMIAHESAACVAKCTYSTTASLTCDDITNEPIPCGSGRWRYCPCAY